MPAMPELPAEPHTRSEVTTLLRAAEAGEPQAREQLFALLYDELRLLAQSLIGRERTGHTLGATALVHEAWLRLVGQDSVGARHRAEFFAAAATIMRRVLVDHARTRAREKRGAGVAPQPLDETVAELERNCGDLLALEQALDSLASFDARKAKLVELRFFAGLGMRESADVLAISLRQAEREWTTARAYLKQRLTDFGEP
jgi:RNA polymerase sigma factor (TIGR02999 family)